MDSKPDQTGRPTKMLFCNRFDNCLSRDSSVCRVGPNEADQPVHVHRSLVPFRFARFLASVLMEQPSAIHPSYFKHLYLAAISNIPIST
jgi:hypothetical protein